MSDKNPADENLDHLEMATMSDKPLGPGWWQASDGTWHPPELHPSMQGEAPSAAPTPDLSTLTPPAVTPSVAPAATADAAQVSPIAPMPSIQPVAQVAPVAPVVQAAPVAADPSLAPVQTVAEAPVDTPPATVAMPGFGPVPPQPVPSLADMQAHPSWSGEPDLRPGSGPMFPDMFQQAVADSQLVSAVSVNYGEGEYRESHEGLAPAGQIGDTQVLEASPFRMPAEIGAFTGASAKKRRWHH
jgi:hypothetical protein